MGDSHRIKVSGGRKINHGTIHLKKTTVAILISDRGDFRARKVIRNKEHYIMLET